MAASTGRQTAMPTSEHGTCLAMSDILSRIGDKWSVMIVAQLGQGTMRFSELRRQTDGISQRMLTLTLRNLERDGLVTRTVYPEVPPRVEYALTPLGKTLLGPIYALWDWVSEHQDDIAEARMAYDAGQQEEAPPRKIA
ncbi:winged helix-turn-helix transcriptional regulator [Pelagibacterium lentulum]|uniref:Transcriptional regulator n=1 Tax=Pelagibacterium lentulum TaxID=2029865 RepID=A0A916R5K9_9HYPH|nr:helix-turn-helix domain-containing protein [Pelagibacterium lentulum]GGA35439.1 transcriptional regulator [Pelagibacterium lentulum]